MVTNDPHPETPSARFAERLAVTAEADQPNVAGSEAAVWRRRARTLLAQGDPAGADLAHCRAIAASAGDKVLMAAGLALRQGALDRAEGLLRQRLSNEPADVAALRMLAELAARTGKRQEALGLLEQALILSPSFEAARYGYAVLLQRANRLSEAMAHVTRLLDSAPANPAYRLLKAALQVKTGGYEEAICLYQGLVADRPNFAIGWVSLGHVLKTVGRAEACIAAYRAAISATPTLGEAWWSLANLKTFRFTADDIAMARAQLAQTSLSAEDRLHLHFALGKALEDQGGDDDAAFDHYLQANAIRRELLPYRHQDTSEACAELRTMFTADFVIEPSGHSAGDPIFIVGMPRAGSTLVEQILASHSQVEGTIELPDMMAIADQLGAGTQGRYAARLSGLEPDALAALGETYLDRTRIHRKTRRPFFTDKMPNNWMHAGLIHKILPNAKIIDVRRHPLACCFSNFKQHFARGQAFSNDLADMARYYRDYVGMMAHVETVLPGRVYTLIYEDLIDDLEGEVRRLLAYCDLSFEPACLRFHETRRAVRTASAQQVRTPLYRDGLDQWRRFSARLGPARAALGAAATAWRPVTPRYSDFDNRGFENVVS